MSKIPKISFVLYDLSFGGAERTVAYLSDYMSNQGDEVSICLIDKDVNYPINEKITITKGKLNCNNRSLADRVVKAFKRFVFVNRFLADKKPDTVFFITATTAKYVIYNPFRRYRLIVSERTNPVFLSNEELKLEKRIFRKCDGVVFQTERVGKLFDEDILNKSVVIPNAIGNMDVYDTKWNSHGKKTIVAVGRLSREKNYPLLIEVFNEFWMSHSDYSLEIYGDGDEKENLLQIINDSPAKNNISLIGARSDFIRLISDARLFILLSKYEGMPNTLMEAMGIGMPCISSDCEFGPAELIRDGWNGLLVPVNDFKATVAAMRKMIEEPEFAEKCGNNAKRILEDHNVEYIGKKYREFILNER